MIIFDVEIEKAIPPRGNETFEPDIQYCGGWRDFAGMGISVACTYDLTSGLSRAFLKEDLGSLAEYVRGKPTAGFNTRRFDIPLLKQHHVEIDDAQHFDILEHIWRTLGLNPDKFVPSTHGGWNLDAICEATLGEKKSGSGAMAPIWWQRGQRGKVIDYCLRDVWLEAMLLKFIVLNGYVSRQKPTTLALELPQWVQECRVQIACDVQAMQGIYGSAGK